MRIFLPAVLLLSLVGTSLAQPAAPATHLTLDAKDVTGASIPGASITISDSSRDLTVEGKADALGEFDVDLKQGTYSASVVSQGFIALHEQIVVRADSMQRADLVLQGSFSGSGSPDVTPSPELTTLNHSLTRLISIGGVPIEVKVVVISMFEVGADSGDAPGEFQYWVEREHLDTVLPFPQGYHDLRMNKDGVLGIVTGMGTARAAASIMALGLDPRLDLTHAYFLVAGIAGIDPEVGSLASAVWAEYVVDGDLAHEIDAREIPPGWATGYVPLGKSTPYEQPRADRSPGGDGVAYHLNPALVGWAYGLTKEIALPDTKEMAARRMQFPQAAAHRPPFVLRGDDLSASTFWHGKLMNAWARDWVKYETDGKGRYAVCGMEDTGTLASLTWLARSGRVDVNRVLVLRTASNFDQQRQGVTAAESLAETKIRQYSAYLPSLDSAFRVGHVVVDRLVADWPATRDRVPGS